MGQGRVQRRDNTGMAETSIPKIPSTTRKSEKKPDLRGQREIKTTKFHGSKSCGNHNKRDCVGGTATGMPCPPPLPL